MDKIDWCFKKKEGISLIEPNSNLSDAYLKKAEDSLRSMRVNVVKEWKIATAYYTTYFSLYSILMKTGVKSEIHSCTIEFVKRFLSDYFNEDEIKFIKNSQKLRIDSQYYVNKNIPDQKYESLIEEAPKFLIKCKSMINKINEKEINNIRDKLNKYLRNQ